MGTTRKATSGPQDAVGLLISDHREVKTLFEEYDKLAETNAEASDRQALAETICDPKAWRMVRAPVPDILYTMPHPSRFATHLGFTGPPDVVVP